MDPKQNSGQPLDPKLQEVYDRVMGTNPSAAAPTPSSATNTPAVPPTQPPMPVTPAAEPPMPVVPAAEPAMPAMPTPPAQTGDESSSLPPMPPVPSAPAEPPMNTPAQPPLPPMPDVTVPPTPPTPSTDDASTTPATPLPAENTDSSNAPADTMRATMPNVIQHSETIKIGMGGSPVSSGTSAKKKGISPLVLIFGAFAFLLVYAVFWVKFFGYSLPFLSQ